MIVNSILFLSVWGELPPATITLTSPYSKLLHTQIVVYTHSFTPNAIDYPCTVHMNETGLGAYR